MSGHAIPQKEPARGLKAGLAQAGWLLAAGLALTFVWQLPYGNYAVYPFSVLATWFHEMGHGICALLLGGSFHTLSLFSNTSGVAEVSGPFFLGHLGNALTSAAGPLGPALAGYAILAYGTRRPRTALVMLALCLLASVTFWIRTAFGIAAISAIAAGLLVAASHSGPYVRRFLAQLMGLQACLSAWRQFNYLFTESVAIDGHAMPSDTGSMAASLLLPYWFWGAAISAAIVYLIYKGLSHSLRISGC